MKVLALLLFFAPLATAEVPSHFILWGGATADLISTRFAIRQGAHEANPVVGQTLGKQAGIMYGMTAVTEVLSIAAEKDGHPKMAKIARYLTGAVHFGAMGWNLRVAKRLK